METIKQIIDGLGCFTTHQRPCQDCPFNPHPGMVWVYGCIKGQGEIVDAAREALRKYQEVINCGQAAADSQRTREPDSPERGARDPRQGTGIPGRAGKPCTRRQARHGDDGDEDQEAAIAAIQSVEELYEREEDMDSAEAVMSARLAVQEIQAVDAVEVVRCRECQYWRQEVNPQMHWVCTQHSFNERLLHTQPDFFCADGKVSR